MFCPKCKSEYIDGYKSCSDCGVDLVEELPEEKIPTKTNPEFIEYELLLSTYNARDIVILKSILEGENITYHIQGEYSMNNYGTGVIPTKVLVKKDQFSRAKEVLKDIKLDYTII
jgi:hypothetical protein